MTTTTRPSTSPADPTIPPFSVAGRFLESLAAQDFDRLASTLSDDVHLRALLPPCFVEFNGPAEVGAVFTKWFGDTAEFELVDAVVGEIGARLHLRWRLRLRAERIGAGWFVVEQQAYADTDAADRIRSMSLLCSGYRPERADA